MLSGSDLARAIQAELDENPSTYAELTHTPEQCARARWLLAPDHFRADLHLVEQRSPSEVAALPSP
jgi:hypothetical protein